jgi:hypothetical protein
VNERNCGVEGCKRKNKNKFMKKKIILIILCVSRGDGVVVVGGCGSW